MIGQLVPDQSTRAEQSSNCRCGGALNVIVETADAISIARKQWNRRGVVKVFELNRCVREDLLHRLHKLLDERVVIRTAQSRRANSGVQRIREKLLIVRAHIENHWQARFRRNAAHRRIEREFSDRNSHAADAEVAEPKDAFTIRHANETHFAIGPIAQKIIESTSMTHRAIEPLRSAKNVAKLLARLPNSRRVNDRHVLRRIAAEKLVERALVAILQFGKVDVTLKIVRLLRKVQTRPLQENLVRLNRIWKQSEQSVVLSFGLAETESLIEARIEE